MSGHYLKKAEEENKEDEILINILKLKFDEGYVEFESKLNNSRKIIQLKVQTKMMSSKKFNWISKNLDLKRDGCE